MQSFAGVYPLSHPFAQMQQLTSMMIYGVFERFPKLRVAYLESGCGWVPYLADRLDESWEHRLSRWPYAAKRSPSAIMRGGNLYYACEREEKTLARSRNSSAPANCFGPRTSHTSGRGMSSAAISIRSSTGKICRSRYLRKILFENPCRFYQFDSGSVDGQVRSSRFKEFKGSDLTQTLRS